MYQASDVTDRSLIMARSFGFLVSAVCGLFVIMAWRIFEFDMALVCYGAASVLSVYVTCVRLSLWYQRPATKQYYKRSFKSLFSLRFWKEHGRNCCKRIGGYFGGNTFVAKRSLMRWFAHYPIMIGCVMAGSIAFPLVFGWVWFESDVTDLNNYSLMVFGMHMFDFPVDSFFAFMLFHGLVWASIPVIVGVVVAGIRRLNHRGDQATQSFVQDFLPLIALLLISVTGLMLSVSYTWLSGFAHNGIAIVHAAVVILTILWVPYSKFLHVPQRSLKLAQIICELDAEAPAVCARCGGDFASAAQIRDLKIVEEKLGFSYESDGSHYQDVCPKCRRANLVLAQGKTWANRAQSSSADAQIKEVVVNHV